MELIIDFYKSLDTLNLIIFWGIIIVIILLLIFSSIMINKNKKLKKLIESKNIRNNFEEVLPIKKETEENTPDIENNIKQKTSSLLFKEEQQKEGENKTENLTSNNIEEPNRFVAEELVMDYPQEVSRNIEPQKTNNDNNIQKSIEIPTKPYQRNVLREMSLSQTSPIGINRQVRTEDKKVEILKDLEESLNNERINNTTQQQEEVKLSSIDNTIIKVDEQIKKDLNNIENYSERKTEIINESRTKQNIENNQFQTNKEESKKTSEQEIKYNQTKIDSTSKDLLNISSKNSETHIDKSSGEKYLEEVSKKLSEAEIPDEIERTNYELQQEEDAIISYKELMEKKDSIQTIDEEDAIISIEELMSRSNNNQTAETTKQADSKLYNLTESEENENFIKELKQFRNDL